MKFFFFFLILSSTSLSLSMEPAAPDTTVTNSSILVRAILHALTKVKESSDKELVIAIIEARFQAIESFAGVLAQLRYAEDTGHTFADDHWSNRFVQRVTMLESLDNQASPVVKEFFQSFDTLCSKEAGYSYQRIAPLLYSYYGNAKAWDRYFKSAAAYNKALRNLDTSMSSTFTSLGLAEAKKRPFLSDLKRFVEALKSKALNAFSGFENIPLETLILCAQNQHMLEKSCDIVNNHMPLLENNHHVFEQFETRLNPANASTEDDLSYYKELCQLDNDHKTLTVEAQDVQKHAADFKKLLASMKVYSSSLFYSGTIRGIHKVVCATLVPNPLPTLQQTVIKEAEVSNYLITHQNKIAEALKHHLSLTCHFHYLNNVYKAVEQSLPKLPQVIEQQLQRALIELRSVLIMNEGPEKKEALTKVQSTVQRWKAARDSIDTIIWKLVQRLCSHEWKALKDAGQAILDDLPTMHFLCFNTYTILDQPFIGYNNAHENHTEIIKTWTSLFGDQRDKVLILDTCMIPYIAELYKEIAQLPCLLPPLQPSAEKLQAIIKTIFKVIPDKISTQVRTLSTQAQTLSTPSTLAHDDVLKEIEPVEQERSQEIVTSTPLKLHAISYEEHQRLKELTRKLFIPVVTKINETDTSIVLRAWRGYSSDENTTITVHKVRDPKKAPPECTIIVDPRILKKAKDHAESNWDRYHTFSFAIEHNYLSSCALIVNASDVLAKKLHLTIDTQSYALCIQARIGSQDGYIVYLVKKASRICYHRFFHKL